MLQLDEAKDVLSFFLSRMQQSDPPGKDKRPEPQNEFMRAHLKLHEFERTIAKKFEKIYRNSIKEKNFRDFSEKPSLFIQNFIAAQKRNFEVLRNFGSNALNRRVWADENEFLENLLDNYEQLADHEISNYLSSKEVPRFAPS